MKNMLLVLTFVALLVPAKAFAIGEAFSVVLTGKEYCGDLDNGGFGQTIFVFVASDTQLVVSFDRGFADAFSIFGHAYQTGTTGGAFVGGQAFVDTKGNIVAYVTIQGTAKVSKTTGQITSLSGTLGPLFLERTWDR